MREIKFRGKPEQEVIDWETGELSNQDVLFHLSKEVYDGSFIFGNLAFDESGSPYIVGSAIEVTDDYFTPSYWIPVIPETVGQFTGKKDNDSYEQGVDLFTEYYEDDVVVFMTGRTAINGTIIWEEDIFGFAIVGEDGELYRFEDVFMIAVHGNIHDNPEMLK